MSTPLPEYIAEMGDEAFMQMVGVPLRTVQSWRRRERRPRPEQAREIVKLAGGRVTFEGIYGPVPGAGAQEAEPSQEVA